MESSRLARQLFGVLKIRKDSIHFELCLWKKKEKEERRKKMKRRNFKFGFSKLVKVSRTFGVNIALE